MRAEKTVKCMNEKLSEMYLNTANEAYRDFLGTTIEALDWVLGE